VSWRACGPLTLLMYFGWFTFGELSGCMLTSRSKLGRHTSWCVVVIYLLQERTCWGLALRTCGVAALEESAVHLEVGHRALAALEPPCTYVKEEDLSWGVIIGGHTIFLRALTCGHLDLEGTPPWGLYKAYCAMWHSCLVKSSTWGFVVDLA